MSGAINFPEAADYVGYAAWQEGKAGGEKA